MTPLLVNFDARKLNYYDIIMISSILVFTSFSLQTLSIDHSAKKLCLVAEKRYGYHDLYAGF